MLVELPSASVRTVNPNDTDTINVQPRDGRITLEVDSLDGEGCSHVEVCEILILGPNGKRGRFHIHAHLTNNGQPALVMTAFKRTTDVVREAIANWRP